MNAHPLRRPAALLLFAALCGCAHKVHIVSDPPGATVRVGRQTLGPTPRDVSMLWWPFRPMRVRVAAPGYRPVDVSLKERVGPWHLVGELLTLHWKRLLGLAPRAEIEVLLVREHGGVGTWSPDDIKR